MEERARALKFDELLGSMRALAHANGFVVTEAQLRIALQLHAEAFINHHLSAEEFLEKASRLNAADE